MRNKLIALKLFLDTLGIPLNIDTVEDRKRIQKAVYLGQLSGIDLGYRFGWYLMGPYSRSLTKDYFEINDLKPENTHDFGSVALHAPVSRALQNISSIFKKPTDFALSKENWLELLASYHYLKKVRNLDDNGIREVMNDQKPTLVQYLNNAEETLLEAEVI